MTKLLHSFVCFYLCLEIILILAYCYTFYQDSFISCLRRGSHYYLHLGIGVINILLWVVWWCYCYYRLFHAYYLPSECCYNPSIMTCKCLIIMIIAIAITVDTDVSYNDDDFITIDYHCTR